MSFDKFAADLLTELQGIKHSLDDLVTRVTWSTPTPPPPEAVTADLTPEPEPEPEPVVKEQAAPAPVQEVIEPVDVIQAQLVLVKFCQESEGNAAKICGYLQSKGVTSMSELTDEGRGALVNYMKREAANGSRPVIA